MTAALAAEHGQGARAGVEGAVVVDVDEPPHLIRRDVVHDAVDAEAGVADHHVEPAEALDRAIDQHLHVARLRHVGDDRQRPSPPAAAISAATASRRSARRAQRSSLPPSRASRSAVARPMPADAPVIAMTRVTRRA